MHTNGCGRQEKQKETKEKETFQKYSKKNGEYFMEYRVRKRKASVEKN